MGKNTLAFSLGFIAGFKGVTLMTHLVYVIVIAALLALHIWG